MLGGTVTVVHMIPMELVYSSLAAVIVNPSWTRHQIE